MKREKKVEITAESFKKWKEHKQKEKKQKSAPSDEEESKKEDFPELMELKAKTIDLALSSQRIELISQEHPSLASANALSGIVEAFILEVKQNFKESSNPHLSEILTVYRNQIERCIRQIANERKSVIVNIEPTAFKDHPSDAVQKHKALQYSIEIRDMEDQYKRKMNFKSYVEEHLGVEKEQIENKINQMAKRVRQEVIRQRFLPYYRRKTEANERTIRQSEKSYHRNMLNLFRLAQESNQLEKEKRTAMRRERVKQRIQFREEICSCVNNSLGHFYTLHDYFSYL